MAALEVFANSPVTTVTSGGTDAPSSDTTQTWTVASSTGFAAASATALPATQFHVADPATGYTSELIGVTSMSGNSWTVTRGAESTTPVAHVAGFTITQVVSAGALSQFATDGSDYYGGQQLTSGETCIPRINVGTGAALVSQKVQFTFWTATKTEVCNNILGTVASTPAQNNLTYAAMGCYQVNADGSLSLLAQCANDTTLFAATFNTYTRALTQSFTKVQGARYGWAVLVVSAGTMPTLAGYNGTVVMATFPPLVCTSLGGQSSLPGSVPTSSFAGTSNMYCGAVTP